MLRIFTNKAMIDYFVL
uniref:Uncharacterized protein n=1 Tax=Anguilla anguilla TaxID=7936 RepID=A0A0E9S0W2_ANGAN